MAENFEELYQRLGYRFNDEQLLVLALTHRSKGNSHNERLEFLGDSIVNCVIAEALYHQFPQATEGELSRWRAVLVNRESLGNMARRFDLSPYLYLGPGELKSGGGQRQSILSCAMEAIIGAIYLDCGFDLTHQTLLKWYEPLLNTLSSAASHKDPKTLLQEYVQSKRLPLPLYQIDAVEGAAHKQIFVIRCSIVGIDQQTIGRGSSRRRAEQAAAEFMLGALIK
jgi:ribonuclease III